MKDFEYIKNIFATPVKKKIPVNANMLRKRTFNKSDRRFAPCSFYKTEYMLVGNIGKPISNLL